MGLFGPSAAERAQSSVDTARKIQNKTIKTLRRQNRRLKQSINRQQTAVSNLAPLGPRQATREFSEDFYRTIGDIGNKYAGQLTQYDPNLLASQSAKRFAGMLSSSLADYTTRLNQASQAGSARLYAALAAPISQFQQIAQDPAFNNLLDQTFMSYASNPPTVTSDVESMKPLYTYNV